MHLLTKKYELRNYKIIDEDGDKKMMNKYNYEYNNINILRGATLSRRIIDKTNDGLFTLLRKKISVTIKNIKLEPVVCTILIETRMGKMELLAGVDMTKTAELIKDIIKYNIPLSTVSLYIKDNCDYESLQSTIDKMLKEIEPKEINFTEDKDIKIYK